jgi:hypothetical protein
MKQHPKQTGGKTTRVKGKGVLIGLSLLAMIVILSPLGRLLPALRRP